jgi:superfamily II DNA or RNA helicase
MALRLDPLRLLIADDVGIGKTVEALLIARELLDRGEITRTCILCPPYLCSQWQKELWEKFRIEAEIVRSGTISRLERNLPSQDHSIFGFYPHLIVSIDYAKSDAHRANFLQHAPAFMIVDEAHGASASANDQSQQQRHQLLLDLAKNPDRHLILLTATPHSGVTSGFSSLLRILKEEFVRWDPANLTEAQRKELAAHLVQRRRADVRDWAGETTPFPERQPEEKAFGLSPAYRKLFEDVFQYCRDLLRGESRFTEWNRRLRYWTVLALLRSVMSSPKAAMAAITERLRKEEGEELSADTDLSSYVEDSAEGDAIDVAPSPVLEMGSESLSESERRRLREFRRDAERIIESRQDTKLEECVKAVEDLLKKGFQPIIWCRFVNTAEYVAEQLAERLKKRVSGVRVVSVTGSLADDERRAIVESLGSSGVRQRVLVATDCLSEGINLQHLFNAVIHYDLPWNPNRLEQREGRVDRFGQLSPAVKAILLYGRDNPVDGAILDVLLRKADTIYKTLGVRVPVPMQSEAIVSVMVKRLFGEDEKQRSLFDVPEVTVFLSNWDQAAKREKESRTRFAQHAIKPDEVQKELEAVDAVLSTPEMARRFLQNASQRMQFTMASDGASSWKLAGLGTLPEGVQLASPTLPAGTPWRISFQSPPPEGAEYIERNHPFVTALAQHFVEQALSGQPDSPAARCGAIRTNAVTIRTFLLLARLRYTVSTPGLPDLLAEEVQCFGFEGSPSANPGWIAEEKALDLLRTAQPVANISTGERAENIEELLAVWPQVKVALDPLIVERARALEQAHRRVRESVKLAKRGMGVTRHFPPDLLGLLVLIPR